MFKYSDSMLDIIAVMLYIIGVCIIVAVLSCVTAEACDRECVKDLIKASAPKYGIEPDLAVAIATVESGLNPNAVGSLGELGVFQLRPEYHNVRAGDIIRNVNTALEYLQQIKEKWEPIYGNAWFINFNLGMHYRKINYPQLFPYYKKVMVAKESF